MTSSDTSPSAPPPSYDDVIAAGQAHFSGGSSRPVPFSITPPPTTTTTGGQSSGTRFSSSAVQYERPSLSSTTEERSAGIMDKIALFSMPSLMLTGLTLPKIDVDLDTEAHLPNRRSSMKVAKHTKRIKCCCGSLWCCGFILLFIVVALPVAMILTAVFGMDECPFRGRMIIIILVTLGLFIATTITLRLVTSALSCCKLANVCGSEKAPECSVCIIMFECLFLIAFVLNVILIFLGTWFVFRETPREEPNTNTDTDYCDKGVYTAASVLIGVSISFLVLLFLFLVLAGLCYASNRKILNQKARFNNQRRGHTRGNLTTSF